MAKRIALVWALFLLASLAAAAGDVAQFVNLGFSPDSKHFMFGQYGITEKGSTPWAEAYIVDVAANAFVPQGTKRISSTQSVDPGVSGLGALLSVLGDTAAPKKQYRIDYLRTGRQLYILVDGEETSDSLEFRDFESGRTYKAALTQSTVTNGAPNASFSIAVAVTDRDGRMRSFIVGDPGYQRAGVKAYHIKQIILAPDANSLVFLIQKEEQDTRGSNIRYMVETARPR